MALIGPGRLPSSQNLVNKTPEQLVQTLSRFALEPDVEALKVAADKAFTRVDALLAEGVMPDAATLDAIRSQIATQVNAQLRQQVKGAIRDYRLAAFKQLGKDVQFTWVAQGAGSCPSCEDRHGDTQSYSDWEDDGLPGSAALICADECNCSLLPNTDASETDSNDNEGD